MFTDFLILHPNLVHADECFTTQRMLSEYGQLSDAAKRKELEKGEKYYYLFFIATQQEHRGKGWPYLDLRKVNATRLIDCLSRPIIRFDRTLPSHRNA